MIPVSYSDKTSIVNMLTRAFDANGSVNFVVKQDRKTPQRINCLMNYAFEVCWKQGHVFLTDDKKGAAFIMFPHKKLPLLTSVVLDTKLAIQAIGLSRVVKVLKREAYIKKQHPRKPFMYFWFLGVDPDFQGRADVNDLKEKIFLMADKHQLPIYVETSGEKQKKRVHALWF